MGARGRWQAEAQAQRGHRGPNCVENGGCCARHYSAAQHLEHAVHGSDTGRVDVQRLVEGRRALPTDTHTEWETHGAGRVRRAWSGRGMLVCMHTRVLTGHCAGAGGAHKEHVVHVRNPRSVEAERLVESRFLPSRKEQTRCGGEIRGTEDAGCQPRRAVRLRAPTRSCEQRAGPNCG